MAERRGGGNGPGVSASELPGGRWRVRWRETVIEASGERRRVQRTRVVRDEATAIELRAKILRSLETGAVVELDAPRVTDAVATLDDMFAGFLRAEAARGHALNTLENYAGSVARVLRALRTMKAIADDRPVPGSMLNRTNVVELTLHLRKSGLGRGTIYNTLKVLLAAWAWGCDDPDTYPGIVLAPRSPKSLMPKAPVYAAAPAPTMAECDAVIRVLATFPKASNIALPVAVIARSTGLRLGQVLALRARDVNLGAQTLTITTGKSAREKEGRTVPLAPALVSFLMPYVARAKDPNDLLLRRRSDAGVSRRTGAKHQGARSRGGPDRTLRVAWEAATVAGEVRREVWMPPNREQGRPDHAFRAAFQAHLVTAGVRDEVIDMLVGHAGGLRGQHYVDPTSRFDAMRAAVAMIPGVDWRVEAAADGNVVPFPA